MGSGVASGAAGRGAAWHVDARSCNRFLQHEAPISAKVLTTWPLDSEASTERRPLGEEEATVRVITWTQGPKARLTDQGGTSNRRFGSACKTASACFQNTFNAFACRRRSCCHRLPPAACRRCATLTSLWAMACSPLAGQAGSMCGS